MSGAETQTRPDGTLVAEDRDGVLWVSSDGGLTWRIADPTQLIARAA
jgi:hypothetical protein